MHPGTRSLALPVLIVRAKALIAGGKHPGGDAPPGTPGRLRSQLRAARFVYAATTCNFFSRLVALIAGRDACAISIYTSR
jgi:hypothetical protein